MVYRHVFSTLFQSTPLGGTR